MKVWTIDGGFGLDKLSVTERDAPGPGPTEARVRMTAWSLNYRDLMVVDGRYNPRQPLPLVPLSDGVGVVEAVGERVTRVKVGDRVAGAFAQRWLDGPVTPEALKSSLGSPGDGVAMEQRVFDEQGLVHVPAHLSDAQAATLPCAGVTAWSALFEEGSVQPGQTVLVQGTGGVSSFALQLAAQAGARVIVTSSSEEKLARARELGAWQTIRYDEDPKWGKTARKLSEGGVDHVVEVGGAGTIAQSLVAVRPGGTISVIGVLDGVTGDMPLVRVLMSQVRMQGVFVGSRGNFERLNAALSAGGLEPALDDERFSFEELPGALAHMRAGAHFGKIVLEK